MEVLEWRDTNAFGSPLLARSIRYHSSSRCLEFVLQHENIHTILWSILFLILASVCYVYHFYAENFMLHLILVLISILVVCLLLHCKVKEESVLVISSMGLQITTTFMSGRKVSTFLENLNISGIVINEITSRQCILSYLTVLTESQQAVIPLFQSTLPRLNYLRKVYAALDSAIGNDKTCPT